MNKLHNSLNFSSLFVFHWINHFLSCSVGSRTKLNNLSNFAISFSGPLARS